MALSADKLRVFELQEDAVFNDIPIAANTIIYAGAAVGDNASGLARPLVAADPFMGFATEQTDNRTATIGPDPWARLRPRGYVVLVVTGVASAADVGEPVYATGDDTFTLTASGASAIGKVHRWEASTRCVVYFEAVSSRSI